jgi:branched-subunit amino acid transport protein
MLSALVVASRTGRPDDVPLRLVTLAGPGLTVRRTRRVWVGILSGMALYALLRLA